MNTDVPRLFSPRSAAVSAAAILYALVLGWTVLHDNGMVGATRKNGFGCTCHDVASSESVAVWIEGPARIRSGSRATFTLLMAGGPAVEGGFNAASGRGALAPADSGTQVEAGPDGPELTHTLPRAFAGDTVRWEFYYDAPADTTDDTLYSVGISVNANGNPTGDEWSFGEDLIIDLYDDSTLGVAERALPISTALLQNYPNPFNPATTVRFELRREASVELEVFDLGGRSVGVIFQGRKEAGVHLLTWDAGTAPSGIYFCRLSASGAATAAVKMLLIR